MQRYRCGFARKDLQDKFKAKYGYDLGVPQNWSAYEDIAEFFTRPDDGLYGLAIYTQKDYDAITMGFENVMFSFGADWKDGDNNVMGVINSPEAIAAADTVVNGAEGTLALAEDAF